VYIIDCGPGERSQYSDSLRAGQSGIEIFHTHPNQPSGPPSFLYNEYWVSYPGVKWPGAWD